jgi:hypothetical protein
MDMRELDEVGQIHDVQPVAAASLSLPAVGRINIKLEVPVGHQINTGWRPIHVDAVAVPAGNLRVTSQ